MQRIVGWLAAAVAISAMVACSSEPTDSDLLSGDDLLVPIPRDLDADAVARRQQALEPFAMTASKLRGGSSKEFYLAVRKSGLNERWFWSTYLKELHPFGPNPTTLGTKVIRFREQNDKLYVFDADDRRATSDVFDPDLIIDAFPIVHDDDFHSLPGSGGFILIDPAAGLNRFGALSDWFATAPAVKVTTELAFVQDFHTSPDGGRYEQIIAAYADEDFGDPNDVESNEYRFAATLGVNIRRYRETPEYQAVPAPPVTHYFLGEPFNIPNTGVVAQNAVHWGFHPGMQPVQWKISPEILGIQAAPELGGADLFAAMKRGIESWNEVFGFPVFEASLASASDAFADDRVNYLIVDPDRSKGFAFADWRTNPNTGEIRGASVYFGGGFFAPFPDDAAAPADALAAPKAKTKRPALVWQDKRTEPLCVLWGRAWQQRAAIPGNDNAQLTGAEKLERYVQHVVAHEIGHTLGLRHNFKGSLLPPTSSVMEYALSDAAIAQPTPGAYDHAAIQFLYGQSPALPAQPFCTDGDTLRDPNCVRFDLSTPDPLHDWHIADYADFTSLVLLGVFPPDFAELIISIFGPELYAYARAGTAFEASEAWQAALDGFRAPLPAAELAANPALGPAADALSAALFREIAEPTGAITARFSDPAVIAAFATDAKNILENLDGVRSYATRRLVVAALKQAQTTAAFLALSAARDTIAAQVPSLPAADQALTRELLARIDAAIAPYFE